MAKEDIFSSEIDPISLREDRKRTGRYVAVALAICITLIGLSQAIIKHTPVVAGLLAPALIMFLYVFWVLYTASKAQRRRQRQETAGIDEDGIDNEIEENNENILTEVTVNPVLPETFSAFQKDINFLPKEDNIKADTRNKLNRTYSIA